jgi:acyl-coenzyme A thioesterase PaaI-like protein
MELKMTAQQVEELIHLGFGAKNPWLKVEEVQPARARTRLLYRESMLRPGRVLSGPALFTAGDLGMYALVLSHVGPELMTVTANFNINFLNKGRPGDIISEARMLKLGRKLAVMEVLLYSAAEPETLVAQVSGSYALPTPKK